MWIASNKCLLCHYHECQAHHITIAEKRGISQKVSDKFTIPLCYPHHQQLHNFGERKYWEKLDIDPVYQANVFYNMWEKDRIYDEIMMKKTYSEIFMDQVDSRKISNYLQMENPEMPDRLADAIANAIISHTYLDLVYKETGFNEYSFSDNFYDNIINDEETLH
jgi:hypothetical protein